MTHRLLENCFSPYRPELFLHELGQQLAIAGTILCELAHYTCSFHYAYSLPDHLRPRHSSGGIFSTKRKIPQLLRFKVLPWALSPFQGERTSPYRLVILDDRRLHLKMPFSSKQTETPCERRHSAKIIPELAFQSFMTFSTVTGLVKKKVMPAWKACCIAFDSTLAVSMTMGRVRFGLGWRILHGTFSLSISAIIQSRKISSDLCFSTGQQRLVCRHCDVELTDPHESIFPVHEKSIR